MRKMLRDILESENIRSGAELRAYVDRHYASHFAVPFKILKAADLMLDEEGRIYDDKVEYAEAIIDVPRLRIANSRRIKFVNCIFLGELNISQGDGDPVEVYLDYCAIAKSLTISALHDSPSVMLQSVNCPEVGIWKSTIARVYVASCRVGILSLRENRVSEFFTWSNTIEYLGIGTNDFRQVTFDHTQLRISAQPWEYAPALLTRITSDFEYLHFREGCDLGKAVETERREERNATFRFLLSHSNVRLSREAYAHVRYLETLSSARSRPLWMIYAACGALLKPRRIIVLLLATAFCFALLFRLPMCQFNAPGNPGDVCTRSLDWAEAFYFSGVSFTTIGYGDIVPVGWTRVPAILEGLVGVLLASSFLVTLTRKYLD
jgi:hypothetical protein